MKYTKLFTPGKIGNLTLKNRIVMPAIGTSLASSTGEASDEIIKYYSDRAKGGCGLIITEITRVDDETGVGTPCQLCVTDEYQIPRLEKLARAIHRYDSKIFVQLHHPGRQSHGRLIGGKQIVGPSAVTSSAIGEMPRELTTEEVEEMTKKFIKGAKIAQISGIDGVELHGAHGYLIGQFISPLTNLRTDKYGGSFANRMRFITEIIVGIKYICGKDFPISVRIDGDEFVQGGLTLEEAVKVARSLESTGVDAINVSSGTYESVNTIIEPISYPQGWKRHLAKTIKAAVKIPVIACDVIRKPGFAEQLLEEDGLDFVALGRAHLADPEWVRKTLEGRENEIRPCVSCLYCIEELMGGKCIKCAVNPKMGRELEFDDLRKDGNKKVVAIVGGGPAGMQSAITLAERGFKAILFEERSVLGGSVYLGSKPPLKTKLNDLLDHMEYEMKRLGVEIKLNTKATVEELKKLNPYAVFVAPGAKANIPKAPGFDEENVCTIQDVLGKKVILQDKKVVVVGSGLTGLETAEYLVESGNEVTVIEMQSKIGPGAYLPNLIDVTSRLKKHNVIMIPSLRLTEISETGIRVQNTLNNNFTNIDADAVVLSLGVRVDQEFVQEFKKNFNKVFVLGDAEKPGRIGQAIQTGYEKAYVLE
ncbi:NAD(P)/FAD-dependent oxidoreductase [Clostridium sp. CS001]|uniref:NAD(P)/FAD-dependent oxidoreductase n=1 Tax=Clostridium sp. CS001 TaxID=2880648 RepID=UPI001CF12E30|nr:NAD(P)/FAD-dependent oxidoreductase [Clostridium sp. CS001]MCB2291841.1 NAD(P)/FAD-dependent oxidoreductase [Clostridium sp. CS001]